MSAVVNAETAIASNPIADSLRGSVALFATSGRTFEADFTRSMIPGAEAWPALYSHWAHQQAERALTIRPQLRSAA